MTYRECIKVASLYLDEKELYEYANGITTSCGEETNRKIRYLCSCIDVITNEISCEYFPIKHTEVATARNKRIEYERLSRCVVDIKYVKRNGIKVNYELYSTGIGVDEDGEYEVCYEFSPKSYENNIDQKIELYGRITPRIVGIGAVAEYCLAFDRFDEAQTYDKMFKDALVNVVKRREKMRVKQRRWT
jgi:hypothetical protein